MLLSSLFPNLTFTNKNYDQTAAQTITDMVNKYHSPPLIQLEDRLTYNEQQEYLKRVYSFEQYPNKISALSEYYKFHFQSPRLFMKGIAQTIEDFVQDKRDLEYKQVTRLLQNKKQGIRETKEIKSQKTNNKKLLENISISYVDFEKKNNHQNKKQDKKQPTFKHTKPQQTPLVLARSKSNLYTTIQSKKILKQPSVDILQRAKSKKSFKMQSQCANKTNHNQIRAPLTSAKENHQGFQKVKNRMNLQHQPLRNIDLIKQKPKPTLSKSKSSATLKNFSLKNVQHPKNKLMHSKNQSNVSNKQQIKALTSRRISMQESGDRSQKENIHFSNRFRSSIQNILFRQKKFK